MVGLVALDDVLRLLLGSVPLVALDDDLRGHFLLDCSPDQPGFRIPLDVIATLEGSRHQFDHLEFTEPLQMQLFTEKADSPHQKAQRQARHWTEVRLGNASGPRCYHFTPSSALLVK